MHGASVCCKAGVCEKYLANGKDVFCAFMDLEKVYDAVTVAVVNVPLTNVCCHLLATL